MKKAPQWPVYMRRSYIFYVFLAIIAAVFLVYFYYHIPSNTREINERGSRILTKLVNNLLARKNALDIVFSSKKMNIDDLADRRGAYENLFKNTRYAVRDTLRIKDSPITEVDHQHVLVFRIKENKEHKENKSVTIRIEDFAQPLFASRDDAFESYLLLTPDNEKESSGRIRHGMWKIVYDHKKITVSDRLSIDTTNGFQFHSDMAGIIDMSISGRPMKVFFQPFSLSGQKMAIAGLIPKIRYQKYIRSTPVNFIVTSITLIFLVVIILPFLKVFLLSPNENITSKDVLATTLSIFLGTAALLLIMMYIYIYAVSQGAFQSRIRDIGSKLKSEIELQIDQAEQQLYAYQACYQNLSDSQRTALYKTRAVTTDSVLDAWFTPHILPSLTRVLWIDSAGNTLAKWHPFNYHVPFSRVSNYEFFKRLSDPQKYNRHDTDVIVYSGKSNITDDFQIYVVKPIRQAILTKKQDSIPVGKRKKNDSSAAHRTVQSFAILLATSLNCSRAPVLPPGFGFCVIDANGEVLIHSDSRRNLSENLLSETRENKKLVNSLQFKNSDIIQDVMLYGVPQDMIVLPVTTGNLSVAVFFNKRKVTDNISRLIHFTVSCLLYIFITLTLCIAFSTHSSSDPSRLRFNLQKIEWIRPCADNVLSYSFTNKYFKWLLFASGTIFVFILAFDFDIRNVLFLSFLLPMYSLWGFIAVRKYFRNTNLISTQPANPVLMKSRNEMDGPIKGTVQFIRQALTLSKGVIAVMFVVNILFIYWLFAHNLYRLGDVFIFFGAQVVYLLIFAYSHHAHSKQFFPPYPGETPDKLIGEDLGRHQTSDVKELRDIASNNSDVSFTEIHSYYLRSLYWSLLLISVLPTLGILTYAYYAEKIQHKKNKQVYIAGQFDKRVRLFEAQGRYKPNVWQNLKPRLDSQKVKGGIYLSDRDQVEYGNFTNARSDNFLQDGPYSYLIDKLYQFTMPVFGEFTIKNKSDDGGSSWNFGKLKRRPYSKNILTSQHRASPDGKVIRVSTTYDNPFYNFLSAVFPGGVIFLIIVIIFLSFGRSLINATMKRLFLSNFFKSKKPEADDSYLLNFFLQTNKDAKYLGDIEISSPMSLDSFEKIEAPQKPQEPEKPYDEEERILRMTHCFTPIYEKIWNAQSDQEKYLLYDLSKDGYINYKNADLIFKLIQRRILKYIDYRLELFSKSFRNYVLGKKDTEEMQKLLVRYTTGGVWQSIRMPLLMMIVSFIVFLVLTQNEIAGDLVSILTPLAALIPVLFQLIGRGTQNKE